MLAFLQKVFQNMCRRDLFQIFCMFYLKCITRKCAKEKKTLISNVIPEQVQEVGLLQIDCQMILCKEALLPLNMKHIEEFQNLQWERGNDGFSCQSIYIYIFQIKCLTMCSFFYILDLNLSFGKQWKACKERKTLSIRQSGIVSSKGIHKQSVILYIV